MKRTFLNDMIDREIELTYGIRNAYQKYCDRLTLEDVFTEDSVYLAAKRCASGFMHRSDTHAFMASPWLNSMKLCDMVLSEKFVPKYYSPRQISERGKIRQIVPPHFDCKIVQKVLCDALLRPALEPRMISSNYASIRGRGTAKLFEDVLRALHSAGDTLKNPVIVMTDYRNYFGSIDNDILERNVYARYFRDERIVRLLRSFSPEDHGLSLGNECSQIPASFYPSPVDHWVKDRLRVRYYFRYMDDIIFIEERERAPEILDTIKEQSFMLGLEIPDKKIRTVRYGESFRFCKERFIYNGEKYYRLINPDIVRHENDKLKAFGKKLRSGQMDISQIKSQYKGVIGSIRSHPNTWKASERLDKIYDTVTAEPAEGGFDHA